MKRTLSDREIVCLIQYGRGRRVTDIAKDMHLSIKTISTYLSRSQTKLRAKTRVELLEFAQELVKPPIVMESHLDRSKPMMLHPFEVLLDGGRKRREDLPDFTKPDDVAFYLANNNDVSWREGKFVRLEWVECHDTECAKTHGA